MEAPFETSAPFESDSPESLAVAYVAGALYRREIPAPVEWRGLAGCRVRLRELDDGKLLATVIPTQETTAGLSDFDRLLDAVHVLLERDPDGEWWPVGLERALVWGTP